MTHTHSWSSFVLSTDKSSFFGGWVRDGFTGVEERRREGSWDILDHQDLPMPNLATAVTKLDTALDSLNL